MTFSEPIDVVISWVDGLEPSHRKKMNVYLNNSETVYEDIAAPTRFVSKGEIYFCVASILRFATFVNKIYLITDEQNPNLEHFVNVNFPENKIPIIIVDHTIIFRDYEEYLPTFNSISIETCLFRIPELSENFVYLNDDFFLIRQIEPEDWFRNNKPVAYGSMRSIRLDTFIRKVKPKKNGHKPFGFKDSMLNAAKILNAKSTYLAIEHTPLPLKKSILEKFFLENPEVFVSNISYKFRNENQFNPQALFYMIALEAKNLILVKENKLLFIKPAKKRMNYIERKIRIFQHNGNLLFACAESIDMAVEDVQDRLFEWLKSLLSIKSVEP